MKKKLTLEWCNQFEGNLFEKVVEMLGNKPAIEEFNALIDLIDKEIETLKEDRLSNHKLKKYKGKSIASFEEKELNFKKSLLIVNMAEFLRKKKQRRNLKEWSEFCELFNVKYVNFLIHEKIPPNYLTRSKQPIMGKAVAIFVIFGCMAVSDIFQIKTLSNNVLTSFILKHYSLKYNRSTMLRFFDKTYQKYQDLKKLIYDFIVKNFY